MGLTFDDVCLVPGRPTSSPPRSTPRPLFCFLVAAIPIMLSAAMDTVTEARLAIAITAGEAGLGIIHRNLSIDDQVARSTRSSARSRG